jgi:hypothetical protein
MRANRLYNIIFCQGFQNFSYHRQIRLELDTLSFPEKVLIFLKTGLNRDAFRFLRKNHQKQLKFTVI